MPAVIDSDALQAVFVQPSSDGAFEGKMLAYLSKIGANRPVLFLAFAPKAAGTFFRQAAMHAINGELIRVAHAQGGRDGTPYLPNLLACYLDKDLAPVVVHMHMQAFAANKNHCCKRKKSILFTHLNAFRFYPNSPDVTRKVESGPGFTFNGQKTRSNRR